MTRTVAVLLLAVLAVQAAWARPRHHQKRAAPKGLNAMMSDVERLMTHKSLTNHKGRICLYGCKCAHKGKMLTSLNCNHFHVGMMPKLPGTHAQGLTKLSMDDVNLVDNDMKNLEVYPNLLDLSVSGNFLDDMPRTAFHHMRQLEMLDLHNSTVLSLPRGIFSSLGTLISLDLSQNQITKLTDETFSHFVNLKFLDLSRNGLITLERSYFQEMAELQFLNLARNELTVLTSDLFNDLIDLEDLDLGHNYLTSVPFGIFDKLISLKKVNLGGTQMFDLDWQMCSVAKYAKANKGKVHVIVHKDTYKFFMEEKPCKQDCAYVWKCPKYHTCKGTIGQPKCMPHREDEI